MENKKTDLRTERTKKHLNNALSELLLKHSIDEITVGDICEKAMVHRTTFYKHFKDKYDLLEFCINELKEGLFDDIINENVKNNPKALCIKLTNSIIDFIEENRSILITVLKNNTSGVLLNILFPMIKDALKELIEETMTPEVYKVPMDILINYYGGAIISLALWDLEHPNKYSKSDILKAIDKLIAVN